MATGETALLNLARSLLSAASPADFLEKLALAVREEIDADWVAVWLQEPGGGGFELQVDVPGGLFSPDRLQEPPPGDALRETAARRRVLLRSAGEIREDWLQHLGGTGGPVGEIACVPFQWEAGRTGLLEAIRETPSPPSRRAGVLRFLTACAAFVSSSAASIQRLHSTREKQLGVIHRLTQLYDVSRVFHSTLERDALLPAIADRVAVIFEGAECRIWLPAGEGEALVCAFPEADGESPAAGPGEEIARGCVQGREAVLVAAVPAPGADGTAPPGSLLCAPLLVDDACLGAVEVVRGSEAAPFTEDDRDFLEDLCGQAAAALRNANLFRAQKKAEELGALLEVSREITSTLDLDRVLLTVVNRAGAIVPAERCSILLAEGRRAELRAVSDRLEVDRRDARVRALEDVLLWVHLTGEGIYVSELDGRIETERAETREKFRRYFEASGMKTFVALPLRDEEGLLGMIGIESPEPYVVTQEQLEVFQILVNQATVAIRNAFLYRQIPLIQFMEPIAGWKSRLARVPRWKWARNGGVAAGAAVLLWLVPWNLKVSGDALVLPARNSPVTSEVEGVIQEVLHREGDRVAAGAVLARLADADYRIDWEEARARYDIAGRDIARHEAALDLAAAGQARIRQAQVREELALLGHRLDQTRITSPVGGVVTTPRLEEKVGRYLARGEEFCRVADMGKVAVEIRVPEAEIALLRRGQRVRLKIDSFPTRTFTGEVEIVGEKVAAAEGSRFLTVRARVEGEELPLKTGMLGRAKIEIGSRSIGAVLGRKPVRFLWRKVWSWLP